MRVEGLREAQAIMPMKPVTGEDVGTSGEQPVKKNNNEKDLKELKEEKNEAMPVEKAVDLLNKTMENYNTELQFTLHKDSGEYMVKVINSKDHTVVREIPPERVLDMVAHFKKMLGLIVDKFI